jgi:hypothetical protein
VPVECPMCDRFWAKPPCGTGHAQERHTLLAVNRLLQPDCLLDRTRSGEQARTSAAADPQRRSAAMLVRQAFRGWVKKLQVDTNFTRYLSALSGLYE